MKKFLLLLLLMTGMAKAQIITNFDPGFKNILVNYVTVDTNNDGIAETDYTGYMDTNRDGEIQVSEAQAVKSLVLGYFSGSPFMSYVLQSVAGIENFTNVTYLDCHYNKLTSLDVSGMPQLQTLKCSENKLTSLNVSGLTNLKYLDFSYNDMTSFDATGLNNLTTLKGFNNKLTSLNLGNLTKLEALDCHSNNLTALNLTGLSGVFKKLDCGFNSIASLDVAPFDLTSLHCAFNQISVLELPNQRNLQLFECYNNNLTTLDVSNCVALQRLHCNNNALTSLFIKNGITEISLGFSSNPNLAFICVDDAEMNAVQALATTYGLTACAVNSYCSFVPGGGYNTIYGFVNFDKNNNGCDVNDLPVKNIRMNLNDGTNTAATFNSVNGGALFYTRDGNFTVNPLLENPSYFNVSATANTFNFPAASGLAQTTRFCIAPNGVHHDLEVVVVPMTVARPGSEAVYRLVYKNKGTQTVSGSLNFSYDEAVLDYVTASLVSNTLTSGAASWNFTNLLPFETRVIDITLKVNAPTANPAVNEGDILVLNAAIALSGAIDEMQVDNQFVYNQKVVNSYDPNEVECLEGEKLPTSKVGEYLHYVIHFENTGTADAINVVLKDVIDEAKFDMSSLQVIESSASVYTRINNNVAEFIFQNINLKGKGGRGHILLKVKSKSNLVSDDTVSQKANIYFDYNFPIETNNEVTTFGTLGVNDVVLDQTVKVYPNPVVNKVTVSAPHAIRSIQLYDVQGRLLQVQMGSEMNMVLDLSTHNQGVYFLKITTALGIKIERMVKQ